MQDNKTDSTDPAVARWQKEIARAQSYFKKWEQRGDKLLKLYKRQGENTSGANRKFAMLWANTEVMKPVVYARPPVPQVSRRFKDKDPVGRVAAELLERASTYECERMDLDSALKHARDDVLLPGRGVLWARYEVDINADDIKTDERAVVDYIHWKDFLHGPARTWEEVQWVAKRVYMAEDEGKARFKEAWKNVGLDHSLERQNTNVTDSTSGTEAKATVWEIWSKKDRKVYFMANTCDHLLEVGDPPLDFENFWPCPKPVWSTLTNESLIPTSDYAYYQDQAEEIDELTARIAHLTDQLKLVGMYAAGKGDISDALQFMGKAQSQNVMIPVESWAALGNDADVNKLVIWWPADVVAKVLEQCVTLRTQLINDVYQVTGLSDIVRGATDPNETATAQQLKSQWGSIRVRDRQNSFAQLAKDAIKLVCEIIAEQFEPQRLIQMANMMPEAPQAATAASLGVGPPPGAMAGQSPVPGGAPMPPDMGAPGMPPVQPAAADPIAEYQQKVQQLQAAASLLRDQRTRAFRIDIETDSTIASDENAEKERRTEFITSIGAFLKDAIPMVSQAPPLLGMAKEMLLFTVRGFKAGRMVEESIEKAMDQLEKAAQAAQGQGPPPDPKVALETKKWDEAERNKVMAETEKLRAEAQTKGIEAAMKPAEMQHEERMMGLEAEHMQMEHGLKREEMGMKREQMHGDMAMQQEKQGMERQQMHMNHANTMEANQIKRQQSQRPTNGQA